MTQDVLNEMIEAYHAVIAAGPEAAGEFAAALPDGHAKALYDWLVETNSPYLVRTLWYCYDRQAFRF